MSRTIMNGKSELQEIVEQKNKLIDNASKVLASMLIGMNDNGVSSSKSTEKDIFNSLDGFTDEEKVKILVSAVSKVIINL